MSPESVSCVELVPTAPLSPRAAKAASAASTCATPRRHSSPNIAQRLPTVVGWAATFVRARGDQDVAVGLRAAGERGERGDALGADELERAEDLQPARRIR
jgi:hypothetical protein